MITQTFCVNYCAKGFQITLRMTETENPTRLKSLNVKYFGLQTYLSTQTQGIHATIGNIEAFPKIDRPLLTSVEIKRSLANINEGITMNFLIKIESAVQTSDKIVIDLPKQFLYYVDANTLPQVQILNSDLVTVNTAIQVGLQVLFALDGLNDKYLTQLLLTDVCKPCQAGSDIAIKISRVKNPKFLFSSTNNDIITIRTVSLDDYLINDRDISTGLVYPLVQIPNFSSASLRRGNTLPSGDTILTLDITVTSALLAKAVIFVEVPLVQIVLQSTVEQVKCRNLQNSQSISCTARTNSSFFILSFPEFCSNSNSNSPCEKNTRIYVEITGLKNPPSSASRVTRNSLTIYAKSSEYIIENLSNVIPLFIEPDLAAKDFSSAKIFRNNNNAGTDSSYVFLVQLSDNIATESRFAVQFPPKLNYPNKTFNCYALIASAQGQPLSEKLINCNVNIDSLDPLGYIYEITAEGVCQYAQCNGGNWVGVKLNAINSPSTKNYQSGAKFVLSARTQTNTEIMRSYQDAGLLENIIPGTFLSYSLSSTNSTVYYYPTSLIIVINLRNPFPPVTQNGKLEIRLPAELLKKTENINCDGRAFSSNDLSCRYSASTIVLTHRITDRTLAGATITINILNIENPSSTKPTPSILMTVSADVEGTNERFDQVTDGFFYNSPVPARVDVTKVKFFFWKLFKLF
jgi:hypothetical protein